MIDIIDIAVYNALVSLQNPVINWLWIFLSQSGIYVVFILLAYLFFKQKSARDKITLFLQSAFVLLLARGLFAESISFFFNRKRPFETLSPPLFSHTAGASFPSGHETAMFSVALILYQWNKKVGIYAIVIAVVSGIARAVSGVHWISDILGGMLIAYIGYVIAKKIVFNKIKTDVANSKAIS